jgi:hypothetical protein
MESDMCVCCPRSAPFLNSLKLEQMCPSPWHRDFPQRAKLEAELLGWNRGRHDCGGVWAWRRAFSLSRLR